MRIRMVTATAAAALIACASPVAAQQERTPGGSPGTSQRDEGGSAKSEGRGSPGETGKGGTYGGTESGGRAEGERMNREQNQDKPGREKSGRQSEEYGRDKERDTYGKGEEKSGGRAEPGKRDESGRAERSGDRDPGSHERRGERGEPGGRDEPGRAERSGDRDTRTESRVVKLDADKRKTVRERFEHVQTKRVQGVDFNIAVGTVVPRTVEIYDIPPVIVEIVPEYRTYKYVRVGDSILIIDPRTHEIVDVIPA